MDFCLLMVTLFKGKTRENDLILAKNTSLRTRIYKVRGWVGAAFLQNVKREFLVHIQVERSR